MNCTRGVVLFILMTAFAAPMSVQADIGDPPIRTDYYEVSFGPQMNAIPGDPEFFVPIKVSFSQPTVRMSLFLLYDPSQLVPVLLAPNIFLQSFTYDLSMQGKIKMSLITDLPPPPVIPPIQGDTIVAWIMFHVPSRCMQYDFLTTIEYFEDPTTPFSDNFIVLQNNDRINPPELVLLEGDVLIRKPLYGDINLNSYVYEIGDAVTFLNFFMGAPFNRQQYANSDCNCDGIQATISDLVYMLRVISYDSLAAFRPDDIFARTRPEGTSARAEMLTGNDSVCDLVVDSKDPISGVALTLDIGRYTGTIEKIFLYPEAEGMDLAYTIAGNILKIAAVDWDGQSEPFMGGRLLGIKYSGTESPALISSDFSDPDGNQLESDASFNCPNGRAEVAPEVPGLALSAYPNPFNNAVAFNVAVPSEGKFELVVFDILGRKVRDLTNDYQIAGSHDIIIWDGTDDSGSTVSSGIYFVRLKGDAGSARIKVHLMK